MPLSRLSARRLAALILAASVTLAAPPLPAETPAAPVTQGEVLRLSEVLMIPEMVGILREEGIDYALSLEGDLFPPQAGGAWRLAVDAVHDLATMQARFQAALEAALSDDPAAVAAGVAFFGDDRGQRILAMELEARRALIDDKVEDAAKARLAQMEEDDRGRVDRLRRFAEVNDLIEMNVQGALNANLSFYKGLAETGGERMGDIPEAQMLADVWGQEAEVRAETEAWLFPFLALAYSGLSDEDLEAYIAFSGTAEGRRLNAALFAAFDALFNAQSRDLGRATGRALAGQDI
jgi:hypothetical protein